MSTSLSQRWKQICRDVDASELLEQKWWTIIQSKYTEAQRFYHTTAHLSDMFSHFDYWREKFYCPTAISLAIFFHDIVYEPKSLSNELDSINMFRDFGRESNMNTTLQDEVVSLIEATITHLSEMSTNRDNHFFLDIDMAVLGRGQEDYDEYASQIEKEYCHLDANIFNEKRALVLESFLSRDHIFATEEFRELYEEKARNNIAREIMLLRSRSS